MTVQEQVEALVREEEVVTCALSSQDGVLLEKASI